MTIGLTPRQDDLLRFLCSYHEQHGVMPTYREACKAIGVNSRSSVNGWLNGLEQRGYIRRLKYQPRAIEILIKPKLTTPLGGDLLPADIQARLSAFCARNGERPVDVLHDAVLLHIDTLETRLGI
jgi:SOS-response transcriptional repressor LexA